ncbi:hypothetical protein GCM10007853_02090 [Algimonas ampicilliniresistens]|uniref:Peptidase M56 domain-containing protein n=1 Tax=Algimonas ampicilliniresistens TaxID=1298735 RepID=A0ABQ5V4M0_9PROT|nr:M56 family metallopeptidase [Algimonas ampicilliniresistens]GLQ22335.1 hypothetical protein GCM10007853_02090 [Algimonas ampicilliniresistens]
MTLNITALWDALGWSILHSLWQAALIGVVVLTLRALVTERRAKLRYLIGMTGLVGTFGAFLATFMILTITKLRSWSPTQVSGDQASQGGGFTDLSVSVSVLPIQSLESGLAVALVPWLGMAWAIGFAFLSLQAYRAWAMTRWLATSGLRTAGSDWNSRFGTLVQRSRTHERVRLFISEHVNGPMTLGALRPIVLVPLGFLTSLPSAQVEAILLHELAHIRRHDFMFGLIQTAIKTVLYFNPTVLILSRLIDVDREQACDDIAVQICGRPTDLARGLAALRLGSQAPALAMAADGGPLLTRLNRLMGRPTARTSSSRLSAVAVSALMLGTAACSTVSMAQSQTAEIVEDRETTEHVMLPETVIRSNGKITGKVNGIELPPMPEMPSVPPMPAMPATPVVATLPTVPVPNFGDYETEADFEAAMEAWGEKMEAWGEKIEASFEGEWEERMEAWGEEVEKRFDGDWEESMEAWGEKMEAWGEQVEAMGLNLGAEDIRHRVESEMQHVSLMREQAARQVEQSERNRDQAERVREQAERQAEQSERAREQAERVREQAERRVEQAERARERAVRKVEAKAHAAERAHSTSHSNSTHTVTVSDPEEGKTIMINGRPLDVMALRADLMDALVKDGFVKRNDKTVYIKLCQEYLTVDGRKVSTEQRNRYAKLISKAGLILEDEITLKFKKDQVRISLSGAHQKDPLVMTFGTFEHDPKK